jgi:2-iminobutanoate/2-iminopropanoate deaminase
MNGGFAMPTIEPYAAKSVWDPPMYSQAVKVSDAQTILYIAGQVAYGPDGNAVHAGDFKAQARAALQCLKAQVEAGGGTMGNIVKVNTYLTDIRHRADFGPIREEFFGKKMPAHTLVAVAALAAPEFLIEIEAVAVL